MLALLVQLDSLVLLPLDLTDGLERMARLAPLVSPVPAVHLGAQVHREAPVPKALQGLLARTADVIILMTVHGRTEAANNCV